MLTRDRHLAAILFTDIVGYTASMQQDEANATSMIRRYHQVLENQVVTHGGEILNNYGDGSLCSFHSVYKALNCSIDMQRELQNEPKVPLRIGLHIGELFFENEKVLGDGLNVASRIQSMGIANSILFSSDVYRSIRNHREFEAVSLGEFEFKNIDYPIEVYALSNPGLTVPARESMEGKLRNKDKSIAVLPFLNLSNDPDQEYFSDGLSEDLLHLLAKIQGLKVLGRTSSFSFKKKDDSIQSIGKKLNVQFVLEGSVRRYENTIRVTTSLSKAEDGVNFWSGAYNRKLENILELQEEIAENIVKELKVPLIADRAHSNVSNSEAYMLTLKGNYLLSQFNEGSFQKALSHFTEAAKLDPGYAPAFAGMALACLELGGWHSTSSMEFINEAINHATHAIKLNEELADAYIVLGRISFYQFDWSNADRNFRKAIGLKPSSTPFRNWYANFLTAMGRFQESVAFQLETIELDPLSGVTYFETGWAFFHWRRDKDALTYFDKGLALESHYPLGLLSMGWLLAEMGKKEEAIAITDKAMQIISHLPTASAFAGVNYAIAGLRTKALEITARLEAHKKSLDLSPTSFAMLLFELGEDRRAIQEVHKACDQHDILLVWLKTFRTFDHVRNNPQFIEVYNKMKFPD